MRLSLIASHSEIALLVLEASQVLKVNRNRKFFSLHLLLPCACLLGSHALLLVRLIVSYRGERVEKTIPAS